MNINDTTECFRSHGNHRLVAEFNRLFYTDNDLITWRSYFEKIGGFAQNCWYPSWSILVKELDIKNFLDLGVHTGQFSILSQLLANKHNKEFTTYSVSPFDGTGDKYSSYAAVNYMDIYMESMRHFDLEEKKFIRLRGLSQNESLQKYLNVHKPQFELMYIDGSHDYDIVVLDIENYVLKLLSPGGIVIFDDSNFYIPEGAPASHRQGYEDVVRAVSEKMNDHPDFKHLFDLTHNKIFRRKE